MLLMAYLGRPNLAGLVPECPTDYILECCAGFTLECPPGLGLWCPADLTLWCPVGLTLRCSSCLTLWCSTGLPLCRPIGPVLWCPIGRSCCKVPYHQASCLPMLMRVPLPVLCCCRANKHALRHNVLTNVLVQANPCQHALKHNALIMRLPMHLPMRARQLPLTPHWGCSRHGGGAVVPGGAQAATNGSKR